jgi:CBS domain-containing protein
MDEASFEIRRALTLPASASARAAARLMESEGTGAIVVMEGQRLAGIVTDRDLALHVLVGGQDADRCPLSEFMSAPVVTLAQDESLADASQRMREHGIRRLPVVDATGRLAGILTADDILLVLGRELRDVAATVGRERAPEGEGPAHRTFGKE